ncbi:Thymidine kinase [Thalassovita mediterranea]|uniref:Thymidine kinase n=2 Tax=Thalassovita mediterranea TaxID=340021 RepID=A0A0N7M1C8_9RHOB|nr:Thymidine kinase [Thalassovita mediterranea]SIS31360.1 thymidine kinase [Thalassovita mediterranea]
MRPRSAPRSGRPELSKFLCDMGLSCHGCAGTIKSRLKPQRRTAIEPVMAKLYFNYSTMNAGKSTVLLQASHNYRERGMQTYLMTAQFDNRAGEGCIASRIGISDKADTFAPGEDLYAKLSARLAEQKVACIFIDEAQFLEKDQVWQLARVVDDLKVPVMCYGLRVDFRGELFPGSAALLALADEMREVRTICHCGKKATMVVRMGSDGKALHEGAQVQIGGNETYVSLCRRHWRSAMDGEPIVG